MKAFETILESRELRIGNWVQPQYDERTQIGLYLLERIVDGLENVYGIPLTEEWLLKFGFNIFEGRYIKSVGNGVQIHIEKSLNHYVFDFDGYKRYFDYIHQLQNLYFALTNKELTIK